MKLLMRAVLAGAVGFFINRWRRSRHGSGDSPPPVLGTGIVGRNLRLARMGMRGGGRYAAHRARRTFASVERRIEMDEEFQIRTAQDVTRELGNMKGAMMKLGQMASYLDTGLPDNVRQTMASLQSDAPPMAPSLVAQQIQSELGAGPDVVFAEWDPVPIAAASIGQVHRAITHDGEAVAVKVQYPGVADAVRSDLGNAGWIFSGLATLFPALEPEPIVDELKSRLHEELDYVNEARNQKLFCEYFRGHPYIRVPEVFDRYSTAQVLTTELVVGHRFDEVLSWSVEERNLAAETLFRFSFGAIYQLHAFNGDPHPGNYLFNPGGQVTFLDFGLVKRFADAEIDLFATLIQAMVLEGDAAGFRSMVEDAGILQPGAPFDDETVREYFSYYYGYVLSDEVTLIDPEYAAEGAERMFNTSGPYAELLKSLNVPPAMVVVQRITLGLMGLFAQLRAEANWQAIARELWPFVDGPPSTPMGSEIAAWRAGRSWSP